MKILIFAYYYPPSRAVGAKRFAYLAEQFYKLGHEVTVITANWEGDSGNELYDVVKLGALIKYHPPGSVEIGENRIKRLLQLTRYIRTVDRSLFSDFYKEAIGWIENNEKICSEQDVVIGTFKPMANILLARKIKKKFSVPVVFDIRDLISRFGRKQKVFLLDSIDRLLDRYVCRCADAIVCVSFTAAEKAKVFYKRPVEIITNGFPVPFGKNKQAGNINASEFKIVYAGSLAKDRNPKQIYEFIERYNNTANRNQIILEIASAENPGNYIGNDKPYINWRGYLSSNEVKEMISSSNACLLLEDNNERGNENLPAKIYEYIGEGKPVIGACHRNSDVGRVISMAGLGRIVNSYNDFEEFIHSCKNLELSEDKINQFCHISIARKYQSVLLKTIENAHRK